MIGILLAAGFSKRFGAEDKLLQTLPDGRIMAVAAAQNMLVALSNCIAVVRDTNELLANMLRETGCQVVLCDANATEMAQSLTTAVRTILALPAEKTTQIGCIIALADMPFIQPNTIRLVANTLQTNGHIVMPSYQGQRGHPVGFSADYFSELLQVTGDEGASAVVQRHQDRVTLVACDDAGILQDIDTKAALQALS